MASNKELMDAIIEIDANHSLKKPGGAAMNNAELAAELKRLKADAGEETPEPTPPAKTEEKTGYRIADGKSLTVPKLGVIDAGKEIKAEWLPGGEEQLAKLIGKGYVKK